VKVYLKKAWLRFVLTLALICGVYTETGIFTALFAFFSFVSFEICWFVLLNHKEAVKDIMTEGLNWKTKT